MRVRVRSGSGARSSGAGSRSRRAGDSIKVRISRTSGARRVRRVRHVQPRRVWRRRRRRPCSPRLTPEGARSRPRPAAAAIASRRRRRRRSHIVSRKGEAGALGNLLGRHVRVVLHAAHADKDAGHDRVVDLTFPQLAVALSFGPARRREEVRAEKVELAGYTAPTAGPVGAGARSRTARDTVPTSSARAG